MTRREVWPLVGLGAIAAITAAWWALALWPLPADTPEWLQRTRLVCFGSTRDALPSAAGWMLLIGEPLAMAGALATIWRDGLVAGLVALWRSRPGRAALVTVGTLVAAGLSAAAGRVWAATRAEAFDPAVGVVGDAVRIDRPAPALGLVDQHGDTLALERFRGKPLLVAFAYGHCTTICPVIVHDALEAQRLLGAARPPLVIVTLDPWRDTPDMLPMIAAMWQLGAGAFAAGGDTLTVERALDAWQVPRARDLQTGDVTHGALIYVVDPAGRIRYAVPGNPKLIAELVRRL